MQTAKREETMRTRRTVGQRTTSSPVSAPTWDDIVQGAEEFMKEGVISKEQVYALCFKLLQDKLRYLERRKNREWQTAYDRQVIEEIKLLMLLMCQISGRVDLPN